jgi:hypothetical protein
MYENLSDKVPKDNIVRRKKNVIVIHPSFLFDDIEFRSKFNTEECMSKEVLVARRLYYRILGKRMKYFVVDDSDDDDG